VSTAGGCADSGSGDSSAADTGGDTSDATDATDATDAADAAVLDADGGRWWTGEERPWTADTCPPFRIITRRLCADPVTACICDPTPEVCTPGHLCLGGACITPGQRRQEECAPDLTPAGVVVDLGGGREGVTRTSGPANLEAEDGGWALILPAAIPGERPPVVHVYGDVEPPFADGAQVEATTCRLPHVDASNLDPRTVLVRVGDRIVLLAAADATYVRDSDCLPEGWAPQPTNLNCPPTHDGEDPDRTCRVCRPMALAFPGTRRPVVARRSGLVSLGGTRYRALVGEGVQECLHTCCDAAGRRSQSTAASDFVLVSLDES